MIDSQYTEPSVLVLRGAPTGEDRYGNAVHGPPERVAAECFWQPLSAAEDTAGAEQYVTGYRVQWPARFAAQVKGCDAVELPVGTFEVKGKPLVHPDMGSLRGFVRADVEDVEG